MATVAIQFGTWENMLLPSKNISKSQKTFEQKLTCTSHHSMCTCQVSRKIDIFYILCKKTKKISTKILSFITQKILFFYETTL
jgi:hypothetical protein